MSTTDSSALQQCEKEPLANSGLIQPNGVLLYIEKASGQIRYASENSSSLLGEEPDHLLDLDGKDWLEQTSRTWPPGLPAPGAACISPVGLTWDAATLMF